MKRQNILIMLIFLALCGALLGQEKNYKIIVNTSVPYNTIERSVIQKIFLGKRTSWDDGNPAIPLTLSNGNVTESFLSSVVRKSPETYNSLWMSLLYTGRATPPQTFASDIALLKYVALTPGTVGYVSSNTSLENVTGVKEISILE